MGFELEISYHARPQAPGAAGQGKEREPPARAVPGAPPGATAPGSPSGAAAPGYVRINVRGPWQLAAVYELIDTLRAQALAHGCKRVLVDSTGLSSAPPDMERYKWGLRLAEVVGGRVRVAVLYPPGRVNRFGENTAANRGADIYSTDELGAALHWLYA